jgi:hypothetical protein
LPEGTKGSGRTSGHKYLQRKERKTVLGPNDLCRCGSGRKFKHCCKHLAAADRPSWDVFSIRERNLMFCRAVQGILGLTAGIPNYIVLLASKKVGDVLRHAQT